MSAKFSFKSQAKNLKIPFYPSPNEVVKRMVDIVEPKPHETLYDLGCGDGRILRYAASMYGCKAVGVDINPELVYYAQKRAKKENLSNVRVIHGDLFSVDLSKADIVTLYLTPQALSILKRKLLLELLPGARIIAHDFKIPGLRPVLVEKVKRQYSPHVHHIYLYRVGDNVS